MSPSPIASTVTKKHSNYYDELLIDNDNATGNNVGAHMVREVYIYIIFINAQIISLDHRRLVCVEGQTEKKILFQYFIFCAILISLTI